MYIHVYTFALGIAVEALKNILSHTYTHKRIHMGSIVSRGKEIEELSLIRTQIQTGSNGSSGRGAEDGPSPRALLQNCGADPDAIPVL